MYMNFKHHGKYHTQLKQKYKHDSLQMYKKDSKIETITTTIGTKL